MQLWRLLVYWSGLHGNGDLAYSRNVLRGWFERFDMERFREMNIFKYIEFGITGIETVTAFIALLAPKYTVTGPQIVATVSPMISAIQATFNVTIPANLVTDVAQRAADAINKYVIG